MRTFSAASRPVDEILGVWKCGGRANARANALVRRELYQNDLTTLTPRDAINLVERFPRDTFLLRGACASLTLQANRVTSGEISRLARLAEAMHSPVVEACLQMIIPKILRHIQPCDAAKLAKITASLGIPTPQLVEHIKRLVKIGGPMRRRRIAPETMVDTMLAFSGWAKTGNVEKECIHLLGNEFGKVIDDLTVEQTLDVLEAFARLGNRHEVLLHHMWCYFAFVAKTMTQDQSAKMLRCMYCLHYYDTSFLYQFGAVIPILSTVWCEPKTVVDVLRAFAEARVKLTPKIVHMMTCRTKPWSVDDLGEIAVFHPGICSSVLRNLVFSPDDDPVMAASVALYVSMTPTCASLSGSFGKCACSWEIEERWEDVTIDPSTVMLKPNRSYRQRDWRPRSEKRRQFVEEEEEGEEDSIENALVPITCASAIHCRDPVDYVGIFKSCVEHFCQHQANRGQKDDWEEVYTALNMQPEWVSLITEDFLPEEFEVKKIQKLKLDSLERQVTLTLDGMFRSLKPAQIPAFGPVFVLR